MEAPNFDELLTAGLPAAIVAALYAARDFFRSRTRAGLERILDEHRQLREVCETLVADTRARRASVICIEEEGPTKIFSTVIADASAPPLRSLVTTWVQVPVVNGYAKVVHRISDQKVTRIITESLDEGSSLRAQFESEGVTWAKAAVIRRGQKRGATKRLFYLSLNFVNGDGQTELTPREEVALRVAAERLKRILGPNSALATI